MLSVKDIVVCVKESYRPDLIGVIWEITKVIDMGKYTIYICVTQKPPKNTFLFREGEIQKYSPLIMELI